jgi:rhamnopyranosyl-N-acetylglucosaminyl-diphospho-decaprenol beta-1,3/1,4-galactofuranosyltransferase
MLPTEERLAARRLSPDMPHIVALIVTYNRLTQLRQSLDQCLDQDFSQIFVVNNCSNDGTGAYLCELEREAPSLVKVIDLPDNLGGAGGFHAGLSYLARLHSNGLLPQHTWCVLFDDDAYPGPGCISGFIRNTPFYQSAVAVGAAVLNSSGLVAEVNRPVLNIFRNPRLLRELVSEEKIRDIRDLYHVPIRRILSPGNLVKVDAISFVGLFVSLDKLAALGYPLPDPSLFIYSDDTLYTWNLKQRGGLLLFDSNIRFVHDTLTGYADGLIRPIWKIFYVTRNSWNVYLSLAGRVLGPVLFFVGFASKLLICFRYPTVQQRNQALRSLFLAISDLLAGRKIRTWRSVQRSIG